MKLFAYYASFDGAEWVLVVHGETRGKAKQRFSKIEPSGDYWRGLWNDIRLTRLPEWDDKPFKPGIEYNQLFSEGDDYVGYMPVDCDCPLCRGENCVTTS